MKKVHDFHEKGLVAIYDSREWNLTFRIMVLIILNLIVRRVSHFNSLYLISHEAIFLCSRKILRYFQSNEYLGLCYYTYITISYQKRTDNITTIVT